MSQHKRNRTLISDDLLFELIQPHYETILEHLGVEYSNNGNRVTGCCPIHGGDNPAAWVMWLDGHTTSGNWRCFTHNCHDKNHTFLGFIALFMSARYGKKYTHEHARRWLIKLLNIDESCTSNDIEKLSLNRQIIPDKGGPEQLCSREQAIKRLRIPSAYFLARGYRAETLKFFDVGDCHDPQKKMYNRAVVPIYDDEKKWLLGCTARSMSEQCEKCGMHHKGRCPQTGLERWKSYKWLHLCQREQVLYNTWNAKPYIEETNSVIIVESPGNVWRLWEAGYYNAVCTLGASISETQLQLLNQMMVLNVYVCGDNDKAGQSFVADIREKCQRRFFFQEIRVSKPDIGEMTVEEIRSELNDQNLTFRWQETVREEQCV